MLITIGNKTYMFEGFFYYNPIVGLIETRELSSLFHVR
jgi:hypothetical protein